MLRYIHVWIDSSITVSSLHIVFTWRWPYWCSKTMKRRPCWCSKPILWELNSFVMWTLSFVSINLHRCWPPECKGSILLYFKFPATLTAAFTDKVFRILIGFSSCSLLANERSLIKFVYYVLYPRFHGPICVTCLVRSCMEVTSQMTGIEGYAGLIWRSTWNQIWWDKSSTYIAVSMTFVQQVPRW